jgi:hypothetical protein
MELGLKKYPDMQIITNIPMKRPIENIWRVQRQSHFLWYLTRVKTRASVMLDEAGTWATSGAGDQKKNRGQMESFLKLCRHFKVSVGWIDQIYESSIPPAVRKMSSLNFDTGGKIQPGKPGRKALYNVDGSGNRNLVREYPNTTLTRLPYDHEALSSFKMDLPGKLGFHDIFEDLAGVPGDKIQGALEKWLINQGVAPPPIKLFEGVVLKENIQDQDQAPPVSGCKKLDPAERIDSRVIVWGILQHNPNIRTRKIMEALNISRSPVEKYRREFKNNKTVTLNSDN